MLQEWGPRNTFENIFFCKVRLRTSIVTQTKKQHVFLLGNCIFIKIKAKINSKIAYESRLVDVTFNSVEHRTRTMCLAHFEKLILTTFFCCCNMSLLHHKQSCFHRAQHLLCWAESVFQLFFFVFPWCCKSDSEFTGMSLRERWPLQLL